MPDALLPLYMSIQGQVSALTCEIVELKRFSAGQETRIQEFVTISANLRAGNVIVSAVCCLLLLPLTSCLL
jgi:hypothetical protein